MKRLGVFLSPRMGYKSAAGLSSALHLTILTNTPGWGETQWGKSVSCLITQYPEQGLEYGELNSEVSALTTRSLRLPPKKRSMRSFDDTCTVRKRHITIIYKVVLFSYFLRHIEYKQAKLTAFVDLSVWRRLHQEGMWFRYKTNLF